MKVVIKLYIRTSFGICSDDVYIVKKFDLPFAPYVGLYLFSGDWECELTEVGYDIMEQRWECYVEPNTELREPEPRTMDEIIAEYESEGWEKEEN